MCPRKISLYAIFIFFISTFFMIQYGNIQAGKLGVKKMVDSSSGIWSNPSWRDTYFTQVFEEDPPKLELPALTEHCSEVKWRSDLYINCTSIGGGLFNQVNMIKSCIRLSIAAGANMILPKLTERDSKRLTNYRVGDLAHTYGLHRFWDQRHFIDGFHRACAPMELLGANETVQIRKKEIINILAVEHCRKFIGCFGYTRCFREYLDERMSVKNITLGHAPESEKGFVIAELPWSFLTYNSDDDPTGRDWRVWTEISGLLRFPSAERGVTRKIVNHMKQQSALFVGIHLRVESDTKGLWWDSFDLQSAKNIDAAVGVWKTVIDHKSEFTPTIYLACGDRKLTQKFTELASTQNFSVVHKWSLAAHDPQLTSQMKDMRFDQLAIVDYGALLQSTFFLGQYGSTFSYNIANVRDSGKYRGSSYFTKSEGKSHLFMTGNVGDYACCL